MSSKKTLGFKADEDFEERVIHYQERHKHDSKGEAMHELVRIGLRESGNPLVARAKDTAVDAAYHLGLAAIMVLILGQTTTVLTPLHAVQVAGLFLLVSAFILALLELARTVGGRNELGESLYSLL